MVFEAKLQQVSTPRPRGRGILLLPLTLRRPSPGGARSTNRAGKGQGGASPQFRTSSSVGPFVLAGGAWLGAAGTGQRLWSTSTGSDHATCKRITLVSVANWKSVDDSHGKVGKIEGRRLACTRNRGGLVKCARRPRRSVQRWQHQRLANAEAPVFLRSWEGQFRGVPGKDDRHSRNAAGMPERGRRTEL